MFRHKLLRLHRLLRRVVIGSSCDRFRKTVLTTMQAVTLGVQQVFFRPSNRITLVFFRWACLTRAVRWLVGRNLAMGTLSMAAQVGSGITRLLRLFSIRVDILFGGIFSLYVIKARNWVELSILFTFTICRGGRLSIP